MLRLEPARPVLSCWMCAGQTVLQPGTSPEQLIFLTAASMSGTLRNIHQTHCSLSTVTVRIAMVRTRLPYGSPSLDTQSRR